jgi:hypothetical protein
LAREKAQGEAEDNEEGIAETARYGKPKKISPG